MKTLDEVIETAPYVGTEWTNDALHYLKEYKNTEKFYSESIERVVKVIDNYEKMVADYLSGKTCNPPLTWDELKTMEEKPVWVEFLNNDDPWKNNWWVVGEVRKDDIIIAQYLDEAELCEDDLGELWQAYRKERHELDQKAH